MTAVTLADGPQLVTPGDLGDELAAFVRAMRASNVSPNTIDAYAGAVRAFGRWLLQAGYPTSVADIEPRYVEEWMAELLATRKPTTAHQRWRGLQRFFNRYAEVDDDFLSPMRKLKPPRLPRLMPRVLTMDELRRVLATCPGPGFEDRRDRALMRMLFDTGARRHEIAALRHSPTDPADRDLDLRRGLVHVVGKGAKDNYIALGDRTLVAVEDYLRVRRKQSHANEPWLWLGKRGRLTDSGISQMLRDRGLRAGIPGLHAHDFRHAATHHELASGMNEADVMTKRGWDSPAMLRRYASTTATERSIEASRRLGLGDKL
jgi:site-specific recombinase XerD